MRMTMRTLLRCKQTFRFKTMQLLITKGCYYLDEHGKLCKLGIGPNTKFSTDGVVTVRNALGLHHTVRLDYVVGYDRTWWIYKESAKRALR